jgi:hypothetical protein
MRTACFGCLFVALLTLGGACQKVATAFDCQAACSKYRECFDAKYDVSRCRASCSQRASTDRGLQKKADACESCIRGHSCMGATFDCAKQCLGVVP